MREIVDFLVANGYLVLFAWVFAEQIGLPIPSIPILLGGGVLVGMGHMNAAWALAGCVLASVVADAVWFGLGAKRGSGILKLLCRISLEPDSCVRRTEDVFAKYGPRALLVAKFIPGLNVAAPPMSAVVRMGFPKFLLFDSMGALVWAGTYGSIGYLFTHQIEDAARYAGHIGTALVWLVMAAIACFVYMRFRQRKAFLNELEIARVAPEELRAMLERGEQPFIVDLRHPLDFLPNPFTIANALRITPAELEQRHNEIPRDRDVILYCT